MAVTKITWENKTGIQNDESVLRKNKVTDADMNEIKQVVNGNADELNTAQTNIKNLQSGQGTSSTDISNLKNRVSTLETDNTKNKSDINTLKSDNQTNKSNISTIKGQISDIQKEQSTQNKNIENLQTNDTKQDELISKLKNALINAETEESKSIHVEDASTIGQLEVLGNHEQENRSGKNKLNLANIQQATKNGITCTYNEDGSVTFNGTCTADNTGFVINNTNINAIKNQTTMSAFYEKGSVSANEGKTAYIYTRINTSDYSKILGFAIADLNNSNPVISQQYKFDDALLNQFSFRIESGTILNNFTVKIMIADTPEEATEYEQYGATPSPEYPSPVICLGSNTDGSFKGSTEIKISNEAETEEISKILHIQQEMLKGDYFVKESDGWKEVHSYPKKIFDGTENINLESLSQGNNFYINIPDALGDTTAPVYSNCFMYYNGLLDKNYSCRISGSKNLNLRCNEKNTVEEFKQMLADKYNTGNPVYAFYKAETPTKLICTEEQSAVLEELSNMDLFEGVNNIITTEDIALLKLKYALDVETYVDNKLNTINQQILEIAGGN